MKVFVIFLVLIIMCCNIFPSIPPEDIGEKFLGKNGFLDDLSAKFTFLGDATLEIIANPFKGIINLINKYIIEPIKNFFEGKFDIPEVPDSGGDGQGGSGFPGGGDGFGGGGGMGGR